MNAPKAVMLLSGELDSTTTLALGVDYGMTLTCYDPSPTGEAWGHCDACLLRIKGFAEAGVADPNAIRLTIEAVGYIAAFIVVTRKMIAVNVLLHPHREG